VRPSSVIITSNGPKAIGDVVRDKPQLSENQKARYRLQVAPPSLVMARLSTASLSLYVATDITPCL
jgi:hypothetical protein